MKNIETEARSVGLLAFNPGTGWTILESASGGPVRPGVKTRPLGTELSDDDASGLLYGYSAMLTGRCEGTFCVNCRD